MSERRACRVIDADRKSVRYRSKRDDDAELREKLRELANQRRRFGYRRLHILLRREGIMISREETVRFRKASPKKQTVSESASMKAPALCCGRSAHSHKLAIEAQSGVNGQRFAVRPCRPKTAQLPRDLDIQFDSFIVVLSVI